MVASQGWSASLLAASGWPDGKSSARAALANKVMAFATSLLQRGMTILPVTGYASRGGCVGTPAD